ncbi:GyrI-like domain-containing protein [Glutamicibacter uratoxydans]|uniref:GyrI-like domain-containing protein n=1 Tax=Glutamicibacter uratoxydans TaxID=43667 RepID=UPI003D6DD073
MSSKLDFKKELASYRAKRGEFEVLHLPALQYLMIDGQGDPNASTEFSASIEALYPVAYKLKFLSKIELGRDYVVPPLEGLWWADDLRSFSSRRDKATWKWTLMLMLPAWLGTEHVERVREQLRVKNPVERLDDIRVQLLAEGLCVQTLHVGSFDDEGPVIEKMHTEAIADAGLKLAGKHHEIYLNDFRRTDRDKLRTILRQPVQTR